jgi:ABC transport system ATP-binding/permease protein
MQAYAAGELATVRDRVPLDHGLTVGRQAIPGQVVLDHPNVSRRHAAFEIVDGTVVLRDLGGTNGTYVNGERLRGARRLVQGDRIDIGPFQLTFDGTALTKVGRIGNVELLVRGVSHDVRRTQAREAPRRILDAANLRILPSEFVAIIGVNGSGKSTLMNIMAGRMLPSEGTVLLNDRDLHANFQAMKQDIAFVPQQDVLHEQLTLRQALDYTAQLRLPPDTTVEQRHAAVNDAARSVDLLDLLDQRIGTLSGGQKKCASLANEILNRPSLLLLDEVTSGLDESTDWQIMGLLRRLADDGVTIIVVTHTLANVTEFCDKIICMGRGGQPTFVGAPAEVLEFFSVHRLGEVFDRTDELGAACWRAKFEATIGATINLPTAAESHGYTRRPALQHPRDPAFVTVSRAMRQAAILLHRNTVLLLSDRRTLVMAAVQSVLIGGLMGYAFGHFGTGQERVNAQNALLLLLCLSAIWLGCNSASKDIVGELEIYRRESDVNLSTTAFISAKYVVSCAFTVWQLAVVYVLVAALADSIPGDRLQQFILLTIGAMAGTAMGLVISAFANTRDQATTIVPLALVPQLILAGVLVPKLPDLATAVAKIAVSGYWLTEAMKSVFITAEGPIQVMNAHTGTLMNMTAEPAAYGAAIVAAHALTFLLIAYVVTLMRHGRHSRGA